MYVHRYFVLFHLWSDYHLVICCIVLYSTLLFQFPHVDCISDLKLVVRTGSVTAAEFSNNNHKMVLKLKAKILTADIVPPTKRGSEYSAAFSMAKDFGETGCVSRSDIMQVRIEAGGSDGWYIVNANTFITGTSGATDKLTTNPALNIWVDGDDENLYSYDAKVLVLSLPDCIASLTVTATTGSGAWAASSNPHKLVLQLKDQVLQIALTGDKPRNAVYSKKVTMADIDAGILCMQKGDVKQVHIEEEGTNGWHIVDIKTEFQVGARGSSEELTLNSPFNLWVDGNDEDDYMYDAKMLVLKLA